MTRFADLVGCRLPLQLAGMGGGISTPALALAVARAGGLGMLGHPFAANEITDCFESGFDPAPGQLGVNFLVPFLDPALVDLAARHARVVDFFYGDPDAQLVERVHRGGALAGWQVGSPDEARAAQAARCDFVIAQGTEAGGHVRGELALVDVLRQTRAAVEIPLLAAGGIATAADVSRAMDAGADGVRVGTRFVATEESGAHPDYVAALVEADGDDTELTTRFEVGWPNAPHRVLRKCITAAEALPPDHPMRWSAMPPTRDMPGAVDAMAMYAGTGVGAVRARARAADVVAELMGIDG